MKKITLIIVLTLASVAALSSRAQEPLLKIEQVMTPQEMQQTGVLTLSLGNHPKAANHNHLKTGQR